MQTVPEPLVSIIVPCYNSVSYIRKTMKSLTDQTYKKLQILCVNDGSKDNTKQVIEELAKADQRIELRNKENGGIETALKQGIDLLRGEYTFLIGHDDTLSKDAIEKAVNAFKENPELDAVRPDLIFVFEDATKNREMKDRRVLTGEEAFLETIGGWRIHTFCLWRTSIFKKMKEVAAKGAFNFDELATRHLYLNCRAVGFCTGSYNYLQHPESVSKKASVRRFQQLMTDMLIRQMLLDAGLYKVGAANFEPYVFSNLYKMGTYYYLLDLKEEDRVQALNFLKTGFAHMNREVVLRSFSNIRRKFWATILSSFQQFMFYIRIKHFLYHIRLRKQPELQ